MRDRKWNGVVLDKCYGSPSPLWVCTQMLLVYHLERKSRGLRSMFPLGASASQAGGAKPEEGRKWIGSECRVLDGWQKREPSLGVLGQAFLGEDFPVAVFNETVL